MANKSILEWLGLPTNFGYALLVIGLVLTLAPYLRGSDFGVIKIPDFDPPVRSAMRVLGPVVMVGAILVHVELIAVSARTDPPKPTENRGEERQNSGQMTTEAGLSQEMMPLPLPVPDSPVTPELLPMGSAVLAPREDGECLYPATVIGQEGDRAKIRFGFGKDGSVPISSLRPVPEGPVTEATPGDAVFAHLSAAEAWAPGVVKEVRGARAYVDLDPDADCAAQYGRPFLWADLNETPLIAREDGT